MKTIVMICHSNDEMPKPFVKLVKTLFPECEVKTVSTHRPSGIPKNLRMGGIAAAKEIAGKKEGTCRIKDERGVAFCKN